MPRTPNGDTTIPMFDADNGFFYRLRPDENGHASARVAPVNYMIFARIITPAGGGQRKTVSIAGDAGLEVRFDTSYVIDARDAERLRPPTVQGQQTDPRVVVGSPIPALRHPRLHRVRLLRSAGRGRRERCESRREGVIGVELTHPRGQWKLVGNPVMIAGSPACSRVTASEV
ncbi:MAG: hypothetical protein ACRDQ2_07545 [Gaiellales bacterium]